MPDNLSIVLAPDSFKESLSSLEICKALKKGLLSQNPNLELIMAPIADGGEGTVDTLLSLPGAQEQWIEVTGPMGDKVMAKWGLFESRGSTLTAVIEMAAAAGLPLVPKKKRNPMLATTFGVGELILHAVNRGANKIILGIGGSATNDGGAGMLQALGFHLLDTMGKDIPQGNDGLSLIHSIRSDHMSLDLDQVQIIVASDVQNPLTGPNGASFVYGSQKGATPKMIQLMDENMKHFASIVHSCSGTDMSTYSGAGAAGGLGFGLISFLNAELKSGFEAISQLIGLESAIRSSDWVVTGEGKLDSQTLQGKGPYGVARLAKRNGKKVFAIGGIIEPSSKESLEKYFDKLFKISPEGTSKEESIRNAEHFLIETGKRIASYIGASR
jgi:glycerate kinase